MVTEMEQHKRPHFPWYKERLKWKYIQSINESSSLNRNKWRFIPSNIDDFRSGIPARLMNFAVQEKWSSSVPLVNLSDSKAHVNRRHTTKQLHNAIAGPAARTIYSRTGPRIQLQQEKVESAQRNLLQHPLKLYAHLEKALPQEIVEEVVEILEPQLKSSQSDSVFINKSQSTDNVIQEDEKERETCEINTSEEQIHNIYQWPLKKSIEEEEEEMKKSAEQKAVSPAQEAKVNLVMRELVKWMKDLGQAHHSEYIDETTIKKLFASNYESEPILTTPIHVIELPNVPVELRADSRMQTPSLMLSTIPITNYGKRHIPGKNDLNPKFVRTRYGAWYLHPKLWKPHPWNEPLLDPKEVEKQQDTEQRMKNLMLNNALAETHGAVAFKNFVATRNGVIIPKFLRGIGSYKKTEL